MVWDSSLTPTTVSHFLSQISQKQEASIVAIYGKNREIWGGIFNFFCLYQLVMLGGKMADDLGAPWGF